MLSFGVASFEHNGKQGDLVIQGDEFELRYDGAYSQVKLDDLVRAMIKNAKPHDLPKKAKP